MTANVVAALSEFGVNTEETEVQVGPTVTRHAMRLMPGVRLAKVLPLEADVALKLAVDHVRIAPILGTEFVGVEVPNERRELVNYADLATSVERDHPLRTVIGVDVGGRGVSARLDKLPHLLVAGATGSGKSVFLNTLLADLVTNNPPERLRLAIADGKGTEFAAFDRVRHLSHPVATSLLEMVDLLRDVEAEMDERFENLGRAGAKKIDDLPLAERPPYLVVVFDEMADVMLRARAQVEDTIARITQLGRAAGIHFVGATQRPGHEVLTGIIRSNTPSRLAFSVRSGGDSRIILDEGGAETLLGNGDGLWFPSGAKTPTRVQAPYLSDEDLEAMLAPLKTDESATEAEPSEPATEVEPATEAEPSEPATREGQVVVLGHLQASVDMLRDAAYRKGREHGAMLSHPGSSARPLLLRDWVVVVGAALLVSLLALLALPLAPLAVGAWAGLTVKRSRSTVNYYTKEAPNGPSNPA